MGVLLGSLTANQRQDMIQKGMNPLNDEHVEIYLSGKTISRDRLIEENLQRMGRDILKKKALPPGVSSNEKEVNANQYVGTDGAMAISSGSSNRTTDVRQSINEDLKDYSKFTTPSNVGPARFNQVPQMQQQKLDPEVEGLSVEMFKSMQIIFAKPRATFEDWLVLFKHLKTILENIHKSPQNKQLKVNTLEEVKADFLKSL